VTFKHLPRASPGKPVVLPVHDGPTTIEDVMAFLREMESDAHERWLALNTQMNKLYKGQLKFTKRLAALEGKLK
jgi:hypothetical protein